MKNLFFVLAFCSLSNVYAQTFSKYQILKAQQIAQQFTELMTLYSENPKEFRADKDLQNLFESRDHLIYNDLEKKEKDYIAIYAYVMDLDEQRYQMSFAENSTPYKVYTYKEKYMGIDLQKTIKYGNVSKRLELTVIIKPEVLKITQILLKQGNNIAPNTNFPVETVYVPAGTFEMGDVFNEGDPDEKPVHTVSLDAFYMGKYEVTNAEYARFLNAYGTDKVKSGEFAGQMMIYESSESYDWGVKKVGSTWQAVSGYENHPVIYVTWYGANEFCKYYGGNLPTEAQWEYAARKGGKKVRFGNGKNTLDDREANFDARANYKKDYSVVGEYRVKTLRVGSFSPNALGLYDMTGNVWEWCRDYYDKNYYINLCNNNCFNNKKSNLIILRGGSWFNGHDVSRITNRYFNNPYSGGNDIGFRFLSGL